MKLFENKNIKNLLLPMLILMIATTILITIYTNKQYNELTIILNEKIAEIVGAIKEKYPEVDNDQIIKLLNSDKNSYEFKIGQEELMQYGIDTEQTNSIVSIEEQMKNNMIFNIILVIIFSILWMIIIFIYLRKRDKKINQITSYINEIKNKKYELNIEENSEDELSNLKNGLYKITIMLKEESENSQKDNESIKMSVQDISHQLKTPLTSISIMLDNLKDNPNMDKETRQKFIFEISKQIEWINWLVISLLKLSKLDANVVEFYDEKINVKKLMNEIIKNLEIPIEIKNQKIIVTGDDKISFQGDYKWQQEAVTNIIKNCVEHNKENGKIYINYEENTLFTKIVVRDEGEGISKNDLKYIFERFYKGKNSSENSIGIGLALAKKIIEKDNGMISCKSEIGIGTEFTIKYMK